MSYVDANGIKFAYLEAGRGPLVLLLHGFPDTAHTWDFVLPKIAAAGFRAVAPFTRGYAPTEIPARDSTQHERALDVLALIAALGETSATVVGHDWGADAAYGAAALEPARITKLITVAIPHPATLKPRLDNVWGVRHFLAYKLPGAASRFAANDFAALQQIYRRWSPAWSPEAHEFDDVRACFANRASLDAAFGYYRTLKFRPAKYLRTPMQVPTVVFAGLDDKLIDPSEYDRGRYMFAKNYTVEKMPGGHFMHREHPQIFAERLLAHLVAS